MFSLSLSLLLYIKAGGGSNLSTCSNTLSTHTFVVWARQLYTETTPTTQFLPNYKPTTQFLPNYKYPIVTTSPAG